jgi:predicted ATP-binding protein involved in virulence
MIQNIKIERLYDERNIRIDFFDDLNILIGDNGAYKTTIMEVINSISKLSTTDNVEYILNDLVNRLNFEQLEIDYIYKKSKVKFSLSNYGANIVVSYTVDGKILLKAKVQNDSGELVEYLRSSRDRMIKEKIISATKNSELKKISREYPLLINYLPVNRIFSTEYEYGEALSLDAHINNLVNEEYQKYRNVKQKFNDRFKRTMLTSIFDIPNDNENFSIWDKENNIVEMLETIKSFNSESKDFSIVIDNFLDSYNRAYEYKKFADSGEEIKSSVSADKLNYEIFNSNIILNNTLNSLYKLINEWTPIEQRFLGKFNNLLNHLEQLYSYTDDITIKLSTRKEAKLVYSKRGKNTPIKLDKLASGEKHLIKILVFAYLYNENNDRVLIIDEPEISLHTEWQLNLLQGLKDIEPNFQIIVASHSTSIIKNHHDRLIRDYSEVLRVE